MEEKFCTRRGLVLAVIAAGLVMSTAMGTRQTFGLFLGPFSFNLGLPVTLIAFAIALHNLTWGLAQPLAGAAADRFGVLPVVIFGALAYAGGLALSALVASDVAVVVGIGLLVGVGISCTSFGVVMTAVGKATSPENRSMAMGLASAGGSLGQVLLVPLAQGVMAKGGMNAALLVLAGIIVAAAPLGLFLDRARPKTTASHAATYLPFSTVILQASRHSGYQLLTLGFFACGFQLAFIATHLPGYLSLCHMPVGLGAAALAVIGLFNMAGSWGCGWLGGRFRQARVLGWLYLIRGTAIAVFVVLPKNDASVLVFAAVMGLTWLGTVPLTSGVIASIFGTRHLGTLFGICFLSHQIGSFLGAWLGGLVFDITGSYSLIWATTAAFGLVAALLHFPINSRAVGVPLPTEA